MINFGYWQVLTAAGTVSCKDKSHQLLNPCIPGHNPAPDKPSGSQQDLLASEEMCEDTFQPTENRWQVVTNHSLTLRDIYVVVCVERLLLL